MVPNLANIAKNHCFPNHLPTSFGKFFYAKLLPLFEKPIVSIDKTIHFGLTNKTYGENTAQPNINRCKLSF